MQLSDKIKKFSVEQAIDYLNRNPVKNLPKLLDWADTFCAGKFEGQRRAISLEGDETTTDSRRGEKEVKRAPLAPAADLSAVEEYAELLVADAPLAFIGHHHRTPPCIFLISMLSTNAWTRVRIWPIEERMLYGRSTDSTGKPKSSRSITEPSVRSYAHGSQNLIC